MARVSFKSQPGSSPELFPVNIFDKIPQNHPCRLVNTVVDSLDLTAVINKYIGGGCSAYHPRMMVKVLFYSYLSNIYSCRKIARALAENIHFMFLAGNLTPDFRTINDFRGKILKDSIKELFAEVVKLLVEMGYVSLDVQYIDGTKIEATSNKYTFVWKKSVEKYKNNLEEKVRRVLADIESSIASDNEETPVPSLPGTFDTDGLRKKLSEINSRLKAPTKQQEKELQKLKEEHLPKLESYEKKLETLGGRNSYSKTDTDATFMRMKEDHMKNGQLKAGYNPQISTENQFITHVSIHQKPNDTTTLETHLNGFEQAYGKQSKEVVADAGYGSHENYKMMETKEIDAYVKYNYFHKEQKKKAKDDPFSVANMYYNPSLDYYVCPMGQKLLRCGTGIRKSETGFESEISYYKARNCNNCPMRGMCHDSKDDRVITVNHELNRYKAQAKELLTSPKGLRHRRKRPIEVEAVFGQLKSNNKFNRFTFRGLDKVEMEFLLMSIGHNFRKMVAKGLSCLNYSVTVNGKCFYILLKYQNGSFYHDIYCNFIN